MTRSAVAFAVALTAAVPARGQTALSPAGDVGSAATRNGYPASGGAVALPSLATAASASAVPASTATPGSTGTSITGPGSGGARSGSGSGSSGSSTSANSGSAASSKGGGSNWVLCLPSGAPGLAPLFAGTDLSCAPD